MVVSLEKLQVHQWNSFSTHPQWTGVGVLSDQMGKQFFILNLRLETNIQTWWCSLGLLCGHQLNVLHSKL